MLLSEQMRKQENFSSAEMVIVDLIMNYGERFSYLSIRELADLCYTSTTTIQRLCRKLGCDGFRDFKIKWLKELSASSIAEDKVDVNRPFHFGADTAVIAGKIQSVYEKAINDTMSSLDFRAIDQAVDLIRKSTAIIYFAVGDSAITAKAFGNRIAKLRKYAVFATELNEDIVYALNAEPSTVGLFVTYRGGTSKMFRIARVLKSRGIPYICLSSEVTTELTEHAAVSIRIPSYEDQSDNIATFYSQECFSFVLNLIYSVFYNRAYLDHASVKKTIDSETAVSDK